MNAKVLHDGPRQSHRGDSPRSTETLIRKLVAQAKREPSLSNKNISSEERSQGLLFTCEVDGVRCMLLKAAQEQADPASLSPREQEIARMIAKGYPNKTIAAVLEISVWTVSTHLRRIFAKLGVNSRAAMVAKMVENGKLV